MIRGLAGRAFEEGRFRGPIGRGFAAAFAPIALRTIARPLRLPKNIRVVCVGGATLGGSGKTPTAIAYAKRLASEGARVVFVGHAYGAKPGRARSVSPNDELALVGDEAILAARAGLDVVVAPSRQHAVDYAVTRSEAHPDVIVIDGPLTTRPARPALSILALDRHAPWGSERVVPAGDLRAPREALLEHADTIVHVDASAPADLAVDLRGLRVGLVTALARPRRLIDGLRKRGIVPVELVALPDHGWGKHDDLLSFALRKRGKNPIDAWLTTEKCALHIEPFFRSERLIVLPSPSIDVGALPTLVALTLRTLQQ